GGRLAVVAVDVAQPLDELRERHRVDAAAVLLEALAGAGAELLELPARLRHADHRHVEVTTADHRLQRGKDLLVGEIARRAEENQRVGARRAHLPAAFSRCPPNSKRMAESRRSWNAASPREPKRSNSAAARTCAGTASSTAASSVQRPSPESDTRPVNRSRLGSLARAAAVKSSSHDATTLPRRHTSAMSARSRSY